MPYGIQYRANISYMESLDEKGHMRNVMIYGKTDRRCDIQTVYVVAEVLGGKAGWRGRRARQGTGEGMRAGRRLPGSTVGREKMLGECKQSHSMQVLYCHRSRKGSAMIKATENPKRGVIALLKCI